MDPCIGRQYADTETVTTAGRARGPGLERRLALLLHLVYPRLARPVPRRAAAVLPMLREMPLAALLPIRDACPLYYPQKRRTGADGTLECCARL